jgi:Ca-activated chloride channel family protein
MPFFRTVLLLAVSLAAPALHGQAGLLVPSSTGHPDPKVLSLREMKIDVYIARGYARVNVLQIFENHTAAVQEGTYRFALSPNASVGDFAVWDGLQRIPGVILEKTRARSIYQEITRQNVDPGLLQQGEEEEEGGSPDSRPSPHSMFSVKIAPIPAMGTKRLELQFQQEVSFIDSIGEFRLVLRPSSGEPPTAGRFTANVYLGDCKYEAMQGGISFVARQNGLNFAANNFKLDKDLQFRVIPNALPPMRFSAFRNPEGRLPDGLSLAPWERPSEIPPEKDGFFLLEAMPAAKSSNAQPRTQARGQHSAQTIAILFETSLSHRWNGLEAAYGHLVRFLGTLEPEDRFLLMPFDRKPTESRLRPATPKDIEEALNSLRQCPLAPGCNVVLAVNAAKKQLASGGRIFLLTSGADVSASGELKTAFGKTQLFTLFSGSQPKATLANLSDGVIFSTSTEIEQDLFYRRLLAASAQTVASEKNTGQTVAPFTVSGGDPKLRDIYPVLTQPLESGALSGWIGRYQQPQKALSVRLDSPLFQNGSHEIKADFPENALDATDLPRRWARARVDDLLARIELEGERREWIDEIIALSKRYKFITPYTAFLAAPRSLLRPRRIQPGDPVLRVECSPGTRSAAALLPFGLKLDLAKRPGTNIWEGRFLAPADFPDGRHAVRILIKDSSGATISETKHFIMDGKAPEIKPILPVFANAGDTVKIQAQADSDVVMLTARIGSAPPVPLNWDHEAKCSVGYLRIPNNLTGRQEVFFEAVDGAKNRGFARSFLEVK